MKIYNEITSVYNEKTDKWETISEDSFDYAGPLDLAQDDEFDYFANYSTDLPPGDFNMEDLSTEQLAQMGTSNEAVESMLTDLGITNAGDNLQYIDMFDPRMLNLNYKQYKGAIDESKGDLQKNLLESIDSPMNIDVSGAEATGGSGPAWATSVLPQIEDINVRAISDEFMANKSAMETAMTKQNIKEMEQWGNDFYNQASRLYQQQNPACFRAGTKISTPEGDKNIEDIIAGDTVKAYDEKTKEFVNKKVYKTHIHLNNKDGLILNNECKTTDNHPFYTFEGEWLSAGELKIGHKILDKNGNFKEIKTIEKDSKPYTVYNFEVSKAHTYFANGYLVHNGGKGGK